MINFSVIVPTYNSEKTIKKCLNSIINQKFPCKFEILVIDNYSKDETIKKIKKLLNKNIKIFYINNKGVIAKSRNLGIKKSKYNYIAFLDSDDWWYKSKIDKTVRLINKNSSKFLFHDMDYIKNKSFLKKKTFSSSYLNFKSFFLKGNPIITSSVVLSSSIVKKTNFDESKKLSGSEDYDLWIRLALKNINFTKVPGIHGGRFVGQTSFSSDKKRVLGNFLYIYNKYCRLVNRLILKNNLIFFLNTIIIYSFLTKKFYITKKFLKRVNFVKLSIYKFIKLTIIYLIVHLKK